MLKISSDRNLIRPGQGHEVILYPFWGKPQEDPRSPSRGRYDRYIEVGRTIFQMAPLEDSDLAVFPRSWQGISNDPDGVQSLREYVSRARSLNKPVALFYWSDAADEIPLDDVVIFRTSFYRSRRKRGEFAMPAWSEDLVERYLGSQLRLRPKREMPVVGFCGWAGRSGPRGSAGPLRTSLIREARLEANRLAALVGIRRFDTTRARALSILSKADSVTTNFVIRDRYLGAPTILKETQDADAVNQVRLDFVQNLVDSDYALCVRGVGNYSYRLYETLCCGRIPVFVDTDCVLPYDFGVDWTKYCVWVDGKDLSRIADRVAEFHARLTPSDFLDLQRECRRFWEERLSPVGFFSHFHEHLESPLGSATADRTPTSFPRTMS